MTAVCATWAGELNEHWTVTFGERMRLETWDNTISLDDSTEDARSQMRFRTQLGAAWSPSSNTVFGLRLANEFRYYVAPGNRDFHLDEVFVDQLYVKAALPWYQPLTFTVGRQDIMLGEGFIVMDGGPLDGSRSAYFNAVRLDWTIRPGQALTAFVCHQEETDHWLPIIHEQDQPMVEQAETGIGLYYNGKWTDHDIEGYFVYKRSDDNAAVPFSSTANTIGGRIKQPVLRDIDLTAVAEAAYQFGEREDADRRAFGGHGYLHYRPGWDTPHPYLPSLLGAGVIYLSGDDPDTEKWEGWDPVFARWPKWNESYIYTLSGENGVAWWTNLVSVNAEVRFLPTTNAELRLAFHHFTAPEKAGASSDFPGGTGTTRGNFYIGKLAYKFDQRWTGHLIWESLAPGDFYFGGADSYAWIRAELMYQY